MRECAIKMLADCCKAALVDGWNNKAYVTALEADETLTRRYESALIPNNEGTKPRSICPAAVTGNAVGLGALRKILRD